MPKNQQKSPAGYFARELDTMNGAVAAAREVLDAVPATREAYEELSLDDKARILPELLDIFGEREEVVFSQFTSSRPSKAYAAPVELNASNGFPLDSAIEASQYVGYFPALSTRFSLRLQIPEQADTVNHVNIGEIKWDGDSPMAIIPGIDEEVPLDDPRAEELNYAVDTINEGLLEKVRNFWSSLGNIALEDSGVAERPASS